MATLTAAEKRNIRNALEDRFGVAWTKPAVDASSQAVEDFLVASASTISAAIDAASQVHGVSFTPAQKKTIVAHVIFQKFVRDK